MRTSDAAINTEPSCSPSRGSASSVSGCLTSTGEPDLSSGLHDQLPVPYPLCERLVVTVAADLVRAACWTRHRGTLAFDLA